MLFFQTRSTLQILGEGTRFYLTHIWLLTKPFLLPTALQLLGLLLWIWLGYQSVMLTDNWPITFRWLLFIAANLFGIVIFFKGFWDYLVWFTAINLMIRDKIEGTPLLEPVGYTLRVSNRSMDYSLIWLFFFALFFIPLGLAFIPLAVGINYPALFFPMLGVTGVIILLGFVLAVLISLFCSLVFQVFVFTPGSAGASFFRSADLVRLRWVKVFIIGLIAIITTQNLLPGVVVFLLDALHATDWASQLLLGQFGSILKDSAKSALSFPSYYPSYLLTFYQSVFFAPQLFMVNTARMLLFCVAYGLWTPLSTCWFALLYADLKTTLDRSKPRSLPSKAGELDRGTLLRG